MQAASLRQDQSPSLGVDNTAPHEESERDLAPLMESEKDLTLHMRPEQDSSSLHMEPVRNEKQVHPEKETTTTPKQAEKNRVEVEHGGSMLIEYQIEQNQTEESPQPSMVSSGCQLNQNTATCESDAAVEVEQDMVCPEDQDSMIPQEEIVLDGTSPCASELDVDTMQPVEVVVEAIQDAPSTEHMQQRELDDSDPDKDAEQWAAAEPTAYSPAHLSQLQLVEYRHWIDLVNLGYYSAEIQEEYLDQADSNFELDIDDFDAEEPPGLQPQFECVSNDASLSPEEYEQEEFPDSREDVEDVPPMKRQKLSCDSGRSPMQADLPLLISDKAIQFPSDEELADDGVATVFQALPSECAREHPFLPNVPPCWAQDNQSSPSNDRDGPPDVGKGASWPAQTTRVNTLAKKQNCDPPQARLKEDAELKSSLTDFENQLVPDETWQETCSSQSLYAEIAENTKPFTRMAELEGYLKDMEAVASSSKAVSLATASQPPCTAYSSCFQYSASHKKPAQPKSQSKNPLMRNRSFM